MARVKANMAASAGPAGPPHMTHADGPEATPGGGGNEYLGFRVTPEFRRRMRMFAAQHDMRLQQVLVEAFEALVRETGGE
jgi:hypothetical protein